VGYRKPTLFEVLAEVHLEPGHLTEARFFDVVPKIRDLGYTEIELTTGGLAFELQAGKMGGWPREKQRVRCWKPGKKELAQIGEDLFVLNLTGGDYPGWDHFLGMFVRAIPALRAGLGVLPIQSLKLHTIDRWVVPKVDFLLGQYLDVGGQIVPKWYDNCSESADIVLGRGMLQLESKNRNVNVTVSAVNDPVHIDIQCGFHDMVKIETDLIDTLERLHSESNATFESIITDRTRNHVMGGMK
jgi:uncharacterized protein (TIGR04255 family)